MSQSVRNARRSDDDCSEDAPPPPPIFRLTAAAATFFATAAVLAISLLVVAPSDSYAQQGAPGSVSNIILTRADGTITVSWDAVQGATKYHAMYSDDDRGSWHGPVDDHTNIQTTSITFSVDNAKSVIVGVRAGNDHGWSAWTDSPSVGPYTPSPPGAIPSVSVTRADGTVTASWDAVQGATKYHAMYSDDDRGSWHGPVDDHTNIQTTSITFNADNAKNIIVGVRAWNDNGWSEWRDSPTVGPYTPPPPGAVSSVSVTRADGTVTASWDAVPGATKYHAMYSDDDRGSWHGPVDDHTNIQTTSITFNADNAKNIIVGVRAGNDHGWSEWRDSPKVGPYTPATPPDAPSGLTATAGDGSVTLSWDDPSDASITGYEYNVNHNDTSTGNLSGWGPWTAISGSDSATTSHTFTGLTNGKEYRYHVRAVNSGGSGTAAPNEAPWFVSAIPAIPVPDAPANLSVTPGDGYLDLSWDAVSDATGYDIRAKTSNSNSWHSVATDVTATSYRYTTSETIDYVAVRATNASGGNSDWTEASRLPASDWLNTVQSSGGASIASAQSQNQLAAPTWGTITRYDDDKRRSGRIDVNWTGDSNATGYNLVCAVAWSESPGWNWHPCGWVDAATDTVKFTTIPANASQPVGIVSYKRGAESQLPPGIIPLEGSQLAHTIPRSYAVAIRAVSTTPGNASAWVPSASIKPLNPLLSNLTGTRTDGQITLSWTPNPWTTGYEIDCAVLGSSYTRCATLTNQDHSATQHSVTISTWAAGGPGGTNYTIDNTSTYDIRICSTNTWGSGCYLAPLIYPNPALTVSNVGTTTATLTIAHHSGNWYYQHTNTGATCEGPVSGTSKDLSSLTANTSYTYSAYSDSTCTNANKLAAAAGFTTLSSVSNLTSTKHPTFESSIHSGQSAAVAFTTGPNASGYVLKSVTAPLKKASGTSGVIFQLRAMKGTGQYTSTSQASDATLANLSTASTYTDTTVTCSGSGCSLSPNTTYFIVASNLDVGTGYSWAVSTSETETAQPSGNGWSVGFGHYKQGGRDSIWGSYSDWNPAEFAFETVIVDYDADDDGLIEVKNLAQLNAMRWDLDGNGTASSGNTASYATAFPSPVSNMGCASNTCSGYELSADLDFDTNGNGSADSGDTYWNSGAGWSPIGTWSSHFTATFDGGGYKLSNLHVNASTTADDSNTDLGGLFGAIGKDGVVRNLGLEDVNVTVSSTQEDQIYAGGLVGENRGTIIGVWVTGSVEGSAGRNGNAWVFAGGLVARNDKGGSGNAAYTGTIRASYSKASVTAKGRIATSGGSATDQGTQATAGGLVGRNKGTIAASFATGSATADHRSQSLQGYRGIAGGLVGINSSTIIASYARGNMTVRMASQPGSYSGRGRVGGLVGDNKSGGTITASFSTGSMTWDGGVGTDRGGLVGLNAGTVTNSYWDTTTSGRPNSAAGTGKTTTELQTPTAYGTGSSIYAAWNVNVDGVPGNDDPWDFGTASQYPILEYGTYLPASEQR